MTTTEAESLLSGMNQSYQTTGYIVPLKDTNKMLSQPATDNDKKDEESDELKYQINKDKDKEELKYKINKDNNLDKLDISIKFTPTLPLKLTLNDKVYQRAIQGNQDLFKEKKVRKAWLATEIHLTSINLRDQTFDIRAWINVFWKDNTLLEYLLEHKKEEFHGAEKYVNHRQFERICNNYSLPIKPHNPFLNMVERSDEVNSRVWLDPANKCFHLTFCVTCTLSERFELNEFPFDAQFLNIKVPYTVNKYRFITEMPKWVFPQSRYGYHIPVKCCKHESVSQYELLSPWLDMRVEHSFFNSNEKSQFKYSLIRLRVKRKSSYYLLYIMLPLFLIISTAFSIFALTDPEADSLGDQLGYLVTLLLTIAAYQYSISADLPESSDLTYIDEYILIGYVIMVLLILNVSITSVFFDDGSAAIKVQYIVGVILGFLWILASVWCILRPWRTFRSGVEWTKISDAEFREWNEDENLPMHKKVYKSLNKGDIFYGSGKIENEDEKKIENEGGRIGEIDVIKYVEYKPWPKNEKYNENTIYNNDKKPYNFDINNKKRFGSFKTFAFEEK